MADYYGQAGTVHDITRASRTSKRSSQLSEAEEETRRAAVMYEHAAQYATAGDTQLCALLLRAAKMLERLHYYDFADRQKRPNQETSAAQDRASRTVDWCGEAIQAHLSSKLAIGELYGSAASLLSDTVGVDHAPGERSGALILMTRPPFSGRMQMQAWRALSRWAHSVR
jgi:hypothetical protein